MTPDLTPRDATPSPSAAASAQLDDDPATPGEPPLVDVETAAASEVANEVPVSSEVADGSEPAVELPAAEAPLAVLAVLPEVEPPDELAPEPWDRQAHPSAPPMRPLLASEALMEDLAPLEPAAGAARWWCAALGVGFLALGGFSAAGLRPGGALTAVPSLLLAVVAFVAVLPRVAYSQRAFAMVVLGLLAAALGLRGTGPAMGLGLGGVGWGLLRMSAAFTLGAALLFRARYRAYRGARRTLAAAFVISTPYVGYLVWHLTQSDLDLARLGAVIALAAILAALTGFMGSETTGAGAFTGLAVVAGLSTELALQALANPDAVWSPFRLVEVVSAAVAFAVTAGIASLGCFQLLAWRFAADARLIDLHPKTGRPPPPRPLDD